MANKIIDEKENETVNSVRSTQHNASSVRTQIKTKWS